MKAWGVIALVAVLMVFVGCTGGGPEPTPPTGGNNQTGGSNQTITPTPPPENASLGEACGGSINCTEGLECAKEANASTGVCQEKIEFKPMKLDYNFNVSQGGPGKLGLTYYFDKEKTCSGRKAVTGLLKATGESFGGGVAWAKTTLYLDTGEIGMSDFLSEGSLLFTDSKSKYADLNPVTTLCEIFANGGGNLITDSVWQSEEPKAFKGVYLFSGDYDVSVVKEGDDSSGALPCTKFSVAMKGEYDPQAATMSMCAAKVSKDVPVPFMVKWTMEQGGTDVHLLGYSNEASPVKYATECMPVVKCGKVKSLTPDQQSTCNSQHSSVESIKDSKGCITEQTCVTREEVATNDIKSSQSGSNCAMPSNAVLQQYITCRWEQNKRWDWQRNNQGCITGLTCVEHQP
jgi:hypothetical protein